MRKLSIAFLVAGAGPSGGLKAVYKIANGFLERGHEVVVYYYHGVWFEGLKAPHVQFMDERSFRTDHDAYVATMWSTAEVLAKIPVPDEKKFYFTQHNEALWAPTGKVRAAKTYDLPFTKIAVSEWVKEEVRAETVIHPPFYYEGFVPGVMKDVDVFVLFQELWWKNPQLGKDIAEQLMKDGLKVVIGTNLTDKELKECYARSKIFVFTSLWEGMPAPPIEAMLSGCMVVSTTVAGMFEYANPRNTVFMKSSDAKDFVAEIKALLSTGAWKTYADNALRDAIAFIMDIEQYSLSKYEMYFSGDWKKYKTDDARGERGYILWRRAPDFLDHLARYNFAVPFCDNKLVLDVGCGSGYGTEILASVALSAVGVEIDPTPYSFAKDFWRRVNMSFQNIDFLKYHPDIRFDTIVSFENLEHVDDPKAYFENVHDLLTDDGTFIFSIPPMALSRSPYHKTQFTYTEISHLIHSNGFLTILEAHQPIRAPDVVKYGIPEMLTPSEIIAWVFVCKKVKNDGDRGTIPKVTS